VTAPQGQRRSQLAGSQPLYHPASTSRRTPWWHRRYDESLTIVAADPAAVAGTPADRSNVPIPPSDYYLGTLRQALIALHSSDRRGANSAMRGLASRLPAKVPRRPPPSHIVVSVLRRDHFTCRYCGGQVVPTPVLRAVSLVWPGEIPWNRNWRADATHPIHVTRSATIDHVSPHAHGGRNDALDNLATACWTCNTSKGQFTLEQLGWVLREPSKDDWDGLVSFYPALWQAAAGKATPADRRFHTGWMRAFGIQPTCA
jgi:5-methylcytosine-specific restriction endonuclease McrA